ncbi:hypothetical protein [Sporichthya sp.]|uniref:hypothetical protein n=1 Tax=Sporichthya sp. TaxID=65475 RepID=UPI00180EC13D|nr:hypothetical protein [Sporichthya sp.]MBA3745266.1 hypothetical protein [Sporichthya sp.]
MNNRALLLPALSVALVAGVLGVQTANGGGDFAPVEVEDPCTPRVVTAASTTSIDALGELLVLYGLDGAACRLGLSRETLVINLGLATDFADPEIDALRGGLLGAVDRMKAENQLPPASELADEALAEANLNSFVKRLIQALPDGVVNSALRTDDVLRRAVTDLDLRTLLGELEDPNEVQRLITAAITEAVKDSLRGRLKALVPDFIPTV